MTRPTKTCAVVMVVMNVRVRSDLTRKPEGRGWQMRNCYSTLHQSSQLAKAKKSSVFRLQFVSFRR